MSLTIYALKFYKNHLHIAFTYEWSSDNCQTTDTMHDSVQYTQCNDIWRKDCIYFKSHFKRTLSNKEILLIQLSNNDINVTKEIVMSDMAALE